MENGKNTIEDVSVVLCISFEIRTTIRIWNISYIFLNFIKNFYKNASKIEDLIWIGI